jgi:predicted N-acetyltransferase YhbS
LVRRADRGETTAIVAVIDAACAEFRGLEPAAAWAAYLARTRDVAARWDVGEVLVAVAEEKVAGTVTFYPEPRGPGFPRGWASFGALAVDPGARRAGLGRRLVLACLDRARSRGAAAVGIHSSAPMTSARALYVRLGFRRSPEHDVDASELERFDASAGDVRLLGYRRELAPD